MNMDNFYSMNYLVHLSKNFALTFSVYKIFIVDCNVHKSSTHYLKSLNSHLLVMSLNWDKLRLVNLTVERR